MAGQLAKLLRSPTPIAPLAVFRVLFGFVMVLSVLRFSLNGWIGALYVEPTYHFTYHGFGWVVVPGEAGIYALFGAMGLGALGIMLGWRYRISAAVFFLSFTYVELIDKANYLNHYYFVSVVALLLLVLPANRAFSLDVRRRPTLRVDTVPAWTINVLKLQLGLVYVFAGLAKLNSEWLLAAMPLTLWLPAHAHMPLVGPLLAEPATAYFFSWAGALYDLSVVFFLLWRRTRPAAYAAVVVFHVITALLFQIGMFPYIMIVSTLIFFSPAFHQRLLAKTDLLRRHLGTHRVGLEQGGAPRGIAHYSTGRRASVAFAVLFGVHFALQLVVPLRAFAYPGNLFWTEQGYRFSWRVMLMEKAGHSVFRVHDPGTGRNWEAPNYEYLTPHQEKMMSTQPDMILQFAHHLEDEYRRDGLEDVEIRVSTRVTLNGRPSRPMINPEVDLTELRPSLGQADWILPFEDKGERWVSRRR